MLENYFNFQIEEICNLMLPGMMTYLNVSNLESGKEETIFIVKEVLENIKQIPKQPQVYTSSAAVVVDNVIVPVIYFNFLDVETLLYEVCVNYYASDECGERLIYNLLKQDRINICFIVDGPQIERIISIENGLKTLAEEVKNAAVNYYPGWSMDDFDRATENLYKRYPGISFYESIKNL